MNNKIYQLEHVSNHLVDGSYDAEVVKNENTDALFFSSAIKIEISKPIFLQANFKTLENTDFPLCNVPWPIISKKMLSVLLEIRPFPHQAIPVTMLDDSKPFKKCFDENNKPYPNLCNNNFVALQLLEHIDAFDWEKSVYKKHPRREEKVVQITKLVFKEPENGFPPIFRLSAKATNIFITDTTKKVLENEKCKGIFLIPKN